MNLSSPQRFDGLADRYASSEVHSSSPALDRLHAILPQVKSVCDVASGAGHTGLGFAGIASRLAAVDPAPSMLAQCQRLAAKRGAALETAEACAKSIPLASESFDLVTCRLAAHHFVDLPKARSEMTRLAKQRFGPQKVPVPPGFTLIRSNVANQRGTAWAAFALPAPSTKPQGLIAENGC